MVSCDTNVLFAATNPDDCNHDKAVAFIMRNACNEEFMIAEQVFVELYCLLRNPTIQNSPLSSSEAVAVIESYRKNPSWAVVDVPQDSKVMRSVWSKAAEPNFARRRIHDVRLAETLKYWGVKEFYTRNAKDFLDLGFEKVINPFES